MTRKEYRALLRRRLRRIFRWFLWSIPVVLFLLVVAGLFVAAGHQISVSRLEAATTEMDIMNPGWRLQELEAARAPVPDEENGILVVQSTVKLLPKGWPKADTFDFPEPKAGSPLNKRLSSDDRDHLSCELEELRDACEEAHRLVSRSTGRYTLVFKKNPLSTLIPHAQETRTVMGLMKLEALDRMENGDLSGAAVSCQSGLNAGRAMGDEAVGISQLVRAACLMSTGKAIERLLAYGELSENDLATLQQICEEEAGFPAAEIAFRGERAMFHELFRAMADGDITLDIDKNGAPTQAELWRTLVARDNIRLQHAKAFSLLNKLVEIGETPTHLRAQIVQEFRAMVAREPKNMVALLAGGQDRLQQAFSRRDSYLQCLGVALAVERYRCAHGDWPLSLETLAPKLLNAPPLDAFTAEPMGYTSLDDGVVIYSECPDGKDRIFDPEMPVPGEGIAVRLWNVDQRGKAD